jgi:putative transposase
MQERKLNRLSGYDYSAAGAYFITICVKNMVCTFGEIIKDSMELNELGKIVNHTWVDLPNHYKNIELSEFIIMPNHVHGIIHIIENKITPAKPLSEVIRGFKTFSSRRINETNPKEKFQWQKSYYDRIIRNEREYSTHSNIHTKQSPKLERSINPSHNVGNGLKPFRLTTMDYK